LNYEGFRRLRGSPNSDVFKRLRERVIHSVGTISHFLFGEIPLGFEWGIHGFDDGICGLVLGPHTHKEILI